MFGDKVSEITNCFQLTSIVAQWYYSHSLETWEEKMVWASISHSSNLPLLTNFDQLHHGNNLLAQGPQA